MTQIRSYLWDALGNMTEVLVSGAVTAGIASGIAQEATPELVDARLAVCQGCPEFVGQRCKQCGCFTAQKVRLQASECPLKKWPLPA